MLLKANGKPSGQAVVQMQSRHDANEAQSCLHGQWMGNRYIEVFAYGIDDPQPNFGVDAFKIREFAGGAGFKQPGPFSQADWGSITGQGGFGACPEEWKGRQNRDSDNKSWESLFGCLDAYNMQSASAPVTAE